MKVKITEISTFDAHFGKLELPIVGEWNEVPQYLPGWHRGTLETNSPFRYENIHFLPKNSYIFFIAVKYDVLEE